MTARPVMRILSLFPQARSGGRHRPVPVIAVVLIALASPRLGRAAEPGPSPSPVAAPQAAAAEASGTPFHVDADHLEGRGSPTGKVLVLTGSVVVTHGDLVARGQRGEYREGEELVILEGDVEIVEHEMTLRSRIARYWRRERRVEVQGDVRGSDGEITVEGPAANYFRDEGRAEFWDGATYREPGRVIRADRMTYRRAEGDLLAEGHVLIDDQENEIRVQGERGRYWRGDGHGWVVGSPRLTELPGAKTKAFVVTADTLFLYREEERTVARGQVVYRQEDNRATAAEATYLTGEDRTQLRGEPVLFQGDNEVRGREIDLQGHEGELDRIFVRGEAMATYAAPESLGGGEVPPSVVSGDSMTLFLVGEEMSRVEVVGQAESRYYPAPGEKGSTDWREKGTWKGKGEWNDTRGDTLTLFFADSALDSVTVRGHASGEHYFPPEDSANASEGTRVGASASGGTSAGGASAGGGEGAGAAAPASPAQPTESHYQGQRLEYDVASHLIQLRQDAEVTYGDLRLKAGYIRFDSETRRLRAETRPVLWDGPDKMLGRVMTYDMVAGRGAIYGGRTRYEKGYYQGNVIRKVGDDVLNVERGYYTSCDRDPPHFCFASRRMKIFVGDRVIAKPLVLKLGRVPVLALPFFLFPIQGDRRSGLLIPDVEFGWSQKQGRYVRQLGYYWVPNDYTDLRVWGDYFEQQSWVGYVRARYKIIYLLEGDVNASYQRQLVTGNRRWDFSAHHQHTLGEGLSLTARADFVSDRTYRTDIYQTRDDRLRRELRSDVALAKRWEGGTMNVAMARTQNLDAGSVDLTLPSVTASLLRRPLFAAPTAVGAESRWYQTFFYDVSAELRNQSTRDTTLTRRRRSVSESFRLSSQGVPGSPALTYRGRYDEDRPDTSGYLAPTRAVDNVITLGGSPRLGGWLELGPSIQLQQTWFNRGKPDSLGITPGGWRRTWEARGSTRTNFYGTFFPRWGRLVGIRHVVTPELAFTYQPGFPQYQNRFQSVGGVPASGSYAARRVVDMALTNNLHLKVRRGDHDENLNNVASLRFATTYNFLYRDQALDSGWSPLRSSLTVQPSRNFDLRLNTTHALPEARLDDLSLSASLRLSGAGAGRLRLPGSAGPAEGAPAAQGEGEAKPADDYYLDPLPPSVVSMPTDEPWSFSLTHRYSHSRGQEATYWLDGNLEFNPTSHWHLGYQARANLKERDIISQEMFLYRDLHCWEMRFTTAFSNNDWRYYFKINIKAHPEIYTERGERSLYR